MQGTRPCIPAVGSVAVLGPWYPVCGARPRAALPVVIGTSTLPERLLLPVEQAWVWNQDHGSVFVPVVRIMQYWSVRVVASRTFIPDHPHCEIELQPRRHSVNVFDRRRSRSKLQLNPQDISKVRLLVTLVWAARGGRFASGKASTRIAQRCRSVLRTAQ